MTDAAARGWERHASRELTIELFEGRDLAAAGWPSITAGPELHMHVYQSREFLDVWMTTIGKARGLDCFLVVVKDRGEPVLYLPFTIETKFNVRLLRFMDGGVADFNAPIVVSGKGLSRAEFAGVWAQVLALLPGVDAIDLQKISGHIGGIINPLSYLDCGSYKSSGHSIRLGGLRQEIYARPSVDRMRRKLRRQQQRLVDKGALEFVQNPAGADSSLVIDSLFDLKHKQYLRTTGHDFFVTPGVTDFYREMTSPRRIGRISHLSALISEGTVASAHLGFVGRGQFYYVLPAYDTRYRSFAVGHMLLHHLIDVCFEEGYASFDLGEGDFAYKSKWETHRLPLFSFEHAVTAAGMLYLRMRRARRFVDIGRIYGWYARGGFWTSTPPDGATEQANEADSVPPRAPCTRRHIEAPAIDPSDAPRP
jgi:CelD/BcsL family acetyltransferase involved in cellulose biosynthesis